MRPGAGRGAWIRNLTRGAVIAAAYAAVTVLAFPISYGPVQCRLSEAMCVLPVFTPCAVWGLTLGCALSNTAAAAAGGAAAGAADILFGTLATALSALLSRAARKITVRSYPLLSMLFPVAVNAAVVGAELTFMQSGGLPSGLFLYNAGCVAAGEAAAVLGAGSLLWALLRRHDIFA